MPFTDHHISPKCLNVHRFEQASPGGHAVLAVSHGVDEAFVFAWREGSEVKGAVRVLHANPVTLGAIAGEDGGTLGNLLLCEFLVLFHRLARGYSTDNHESKLDCDCS